MMAKWWKRGLCLLASTMLALGLFVVTVRAATNEAKTDDDLIAGYIEQCLNAELPQAGSSSLPRLQARPSTGLSGNDYAIYSVLKSLVAEVAAGQRASTVFEIPITNYCRQCSWNADELGVAAIAVDDEVTDEAAAAAWSKAAFDLHAVENALLADCPYELYWFDKTLDIGIDYSDLSAEVVDGEWRIGFDQDAVLTVSMPVSADYSANGQAGGFDLDTATGERINRAVDNAWSIVCNAPCDTVFDTLVYFKIMICEWTDYDFDAAADSDMPYGDPWQIINVFDDDPSTTVVCEGYAKAFQYLCDLVNITGVKCYAVTGTMNDGMKTENHMWNLVNMDDDKVYLVDVTNCDFETIGYPDELFLAPCSSGTVENGYVFEANGFDITYVYDAEALSTYMRDELTLAGSAYVAPGTLPVSEGWTQAGTCEYQIKDGVLTYRPLGNGTSGTLPNTNYDDAPLPGVRDEGVTKVVFEKGVRANKSLCGAFAYSGITSVDASNLDTSDCQSLRYLFYACTVLTSVNIADWDTSSVIDMCYAFDICTSLASLDISDWNTSHVTHTAFMFHYCLSLTSLDLSRWDTSSMISMAGMFRECESLKTVDVSGWDTSNVVYMSELFYFCSALEYVDVSNWDTSSVQYMDWMFTYCDCIRGLDPSRWDTSNVVDMYRLFEGCKSLTSLNLANWDTSSAQRMIYMFSGCTLLHRIFVGSGWTVENISPYDEMFLGDHNLVGGLGGRSWSMNGNVFVWAAYAHIDEEGNTGYLTDVAELNSHAPGWAEEDGATYYYEEDGTKHAGWLAEDGYYYYFGNYCKLWVDTWFMDVEREEGPYYYADADGKIVTNAWKDYNGKYYYLGKDGKISKNSWVTYNGVYYYVGGDGRVVTKRWVRSGKDNYWVGANGRVATSTWIWYNDWIEYDTGTYYHTGGSYYYVGSNGKMVKNGWARYGNSYYYMDAYGAVVTNNWVKYGGYYYFMDNNGRPFTNTTLIINGKSYYFDSNGRWVA